jgi:hypothetical protein
MMSENDKPMTAKEQLQKLLADGRPFFGVFASLPDESGAVDRGMLLIAPDVPIHRLGLLVGATLAKAIEAPTIIARTMPAAVGEKFCERVEQVLDAVPVETDGNTQGHMVIFDRRKK